MDQLGKTKKFGIFSGHIEEYFQPANEICHFSVATKPRTTCKFVSLFSSCVGSCDAAFQKKFICGVQCFLI